MIRGLAFAVATVAAVATTGCGAAQTATHTETRTVFKTVTTSARSATTAATTSSGASTTSINGALTGDVSVRLDPAVLKKFQTLVPKGTTVGAADCGQLSVKPTGYDCYISIVGDNPDSVYFYVATLLDAKTFEAVSSPDNRSSSWIPPATFRGSY